MAGPEFVVEVGEDNGVDIEDAKDEVTRDQNYPFESNLYDPEYMNGWHIWRCVTRKIGFARSSTLHHILVENGTLYSETWTDPYHLFPKDLIRNAEAGHGPSLDVNLIPLFGHSQLGVSRLTFVDLLEHVQVPPHFAAVTADNNGVCTAFLGHPTASGIPKSLELYVKVPIAPALNGSFYFKHDLETSNTKMTIVFDDHVLKRLEEVLQQSRPYNPTSMTVKDPFITLTAIVSESVAMLEEQRNALDAEVSTREASTGVTLVTWTLRKQISIDAYPPLFDMLHLCQQELMYMERTLEFEVHLIAFLREQHDTLTQMRLQNTSSEDAKMAIRAQAQKITNSFSMSASQIQHMLNQVRTLSLRIRIQLGIVESRLNQSNAQTQAQMSKTQVVIAEETKKDSMAMKTIAAVTMLFLPGTFTASLFAMPFFGTTKGNGQGDGFDVSHWFWLYVIITVPLTVMVVLAWLIWQRWLIGKSSSQASGDVEKG